MKSFFVSPSFLEMCCEANSCAKLSSDNEVKTAKTIIDFRGKLWVCSGSCSQNMTWLHANLYECVPAAFYKGPAYDDDKPGYQGMLFTCSYFKNLRCNSPLEYVFTGLQIEVKIVNPFETNLYRAMR